MTDGQDEQWLRAALGLGPQDAPFSWQRRLWMSLRRGEIPSALDIPTGLGKTSVMALWLVARALGAPLPRRLIYVVDRRAVVDQATRVAEGLRATVEQIPGLQAALGLPASGLPISTLRGQHADNREWLSDPTAPAIVVGTVDMVGSRLLFEGYGVSRKMRPYHAGMLGADTLVLLDEAHLVPPFEHLLRAIVEPGAEAVFGPRDDAGAQVVPALRLMALSATGRGADDAFVLLEADWKEVAGDDDIVRRVVRQRYTAKKSLTLVPLADDKEKTLVEQLVAQAWALTEEGQRPLRCAVFCNSRKVALAVKKSLEALGAKKGKRKGAAVEGPAQTVLLLTGQRRVHERELVAKELEQYGFLGAPKPLERPAFLVATSAGEVGVDLDAECAVLDLVAWERMVQRLGRVNRRGTGEARVVVVHRADDEGADEAAPETVSESVSEGDAGEEAGEDGEAAKAKNKARERAERRRWLRPWLHLRDEAGGDLSPRALREAKARWPELLAAATTPEPLRPALTRALVDAWSMTSLAEHTGRPEVGPWLRGWEPEDAAETTVVWRRFLPESAEGMPADDEAVGAWFDAVPIELREGVSAPFFEVRALLMERCRAWLATQGAGASMAKAAETAEDEVSLDASADAESADDTLDGANADASAGAAAAPEEEAEEEVPEAVARRSSRRPGRNAFGLVIDAAGAIVQWLTVEDFRSLAPGVADAKSKKPALEKSLDALLRQNTLVLRADLGGLDASGLLDAEADGPVTAADDAGDPMKLGLRVREVAAEGDEDAEDGWRVTHRLVRQRSEEGEPAVWLEVARDRWRAPVSEDQRSVQRSRPQGLAEHEAWVADEARALASGLGLSASLVELLALAGRLHDEGKRAKVWQDAFCAPRDGRPYAKTKGPCFPQRLLGYRHEFGSLLDAEGDAAVKALSADDRALVLHLIASHHGGARPWISAEGCAQAPPSVLAAKQTEAALRFARLQRRWGPWGLAWLETLLRAADQRASRRNDTGEQ